jgi:hypothetical protein
MDRHYDRPAHEKPDKPGAGTGILVSQHVFDLRPRNAVTKSAIAYNSRNLQNSGTALPNAESFAAWGEF